GETPRRVGVFEVEGADGDGRAFCKWLGHAWSMREWQFGDSVFSTCTRADRHTGPRDDGKLLIFRGLAEDPSLPPSEPTHV
ncbi:hypothetical protein ACSFB2_12560, partial [Glaesserella parasuis]